MQREANDALDPANSPESWKFERANWESDNAITMLQRVMDTSRTPNGIGGIKLMWHQLVFLRNHANSAREPCLSVADFEQHVKHEYQFIRLCRRDRLKQAVSWAKALQSNAWNSIAERRHSVKYTYNYLLIRLRLRGIRQEEEGFDAFFSRLGVTPLTLFYEDFLENPAKSIHVIASELGVISEAPAELDDGLVVIQSDSVNAAWVERYKQDSRSLVSRVRAGAISLFSPVLWKHVFSAMKSRV